MTNIVVILTCYNRCDYTKQAITRLVSGNRDCSFKFIVVDDASTDGTPDMLKELSAKYDIRYIAGGGNLFYSGGMHLGMASALELPKESYEYILLINDDVRFSDHCIEKIVEQSTDQNDTVIVGVCSSDDGKLSYGGVKYDRGINYRFLGTEDCKENADTFNANCVLIPKKIFLSTPIMDAHYQHSLGDFDYGLSISKQGYSIYPSREYVGVCNDNPPTGTWRDVSLSPRERIRLKESPKGSPAGQWFYFLKKNFNIRMAIVKSITPYIRILLGK